MPEAARERTRSARGTLAERWRNAGGTLALSGKAADGLPTPRHPLKSVHTRKAAPCARL